ncbi:hypothetical protein ACFYN3_42910 [Streptomyces lavendulae]|uniref:hypothetical protein n=1 Tax=Streptomyces lavendulae TaxID=1914 RepID=UPI0033CFDB56
MKKRSPLLALATASVVTAGVMATSVPAQAADDWITVSGWSINTQARDTLWTISYPNSASQAQGRGQVHWSDVQSNGGYYTEVRAAANDSVRDGYCAVTQLRYQKKINGTWTWQYRAPAVDCVDSDGDAYWSSHYKSREPIRNAQFRVCLGSPDGEISLPVQCSPGWD